MFFLLGISYNHTMEYFYTRGEVAQSLEFADWIPRLICSRGDVLQSWPCYILIIEGPPDPCSPAVEQISTSQHLYRIILLSYRASLLITSGLSLMSYIHLILSNSTAQTQLDFMSGILSNRGEKWFYTILTRCLLSVVFCIINIPTALCLRFIKDE